MYLYDLLFSIQNYADIVGAQARRAVTGVWSEDPWILHRPDSRQISTQVLTRIGLCYHYLVLGLLSRVQATGCPDTHGIPSTCGCTVDQTRHVSSLRAANSFRLRMLVGINNNGPSELGT